MKTAAALLEEYMVNQDEELIYVSSKDIDPISKTPVFSFQLSLYGGVYVVKGSGPSKKIAKQLTAKKMLLKLAKDRSNVQVLLDKNKMSATSLDFEQFLEPCGNCSNQKKPSKMKTAAALLEEYMVNQDEELIYVASKDIDPISKTPVFSFQLSLYGGVYVVKGSGPSKKIAKQVTARNMLLKLAKDRSNVQVLLDKNKMSATSSDFEQFLETCGNSSNQKKATTTKTPVSILEEYLVVLPNYLFSRVVSEAPSSTISFHCTLDLFDGKYIAEATALTKQEAKQKTAKNMLIQLSREKERLRHLLELSEDLGDDYLSRLLQDKHDTKSEEKISRESSPEKEMIIENLGKNEVKTTCQTCSSSKGRVVEKKVITHISDNLEIDKKVELSATQDRSTEKTSMNTKYTQSNNEESPIENKRSEKDAEGNSITVLNKKSRCTVNEPFSQGVGMSTKTPVTLLQEYLHQLQDLNYRPNYIFSQDKSNPLWFHCKLELGNGKYSAESTGLTKKHTKHKTAKEMLIQLSKGSPVVKQLLKMNKFHEQEDDDVMNDIENNDTAAAPSDGLEMSNSQEPVMKTPVSLLQEYLSERRLKPNYVSSELPTKPSEQKVYQYELTVNLFNKKFDAKASAQSKKLAKHETAKNMLLKISEVSAELKDLLERNDYYEKMEKVCIGNKSTIVRNNPIYQLDTFCRYHNFRSPEYTFIEESGKVFTMKCEVEYIIVEGTGIKIQAAKHDSAAKMLIRLQEELKKIEQSEKSPHKVERTEIHFSDVDQEYQEMFDEIYGKAESNHFSSPIIKEENLNARDSNNDACGRSDEQHDDERGYYRAKIRKPSMIESVQVEKASHSSVERMTTPCDISDNKSQQLNDILKETTESISPTISTESNSISTISNELNSNLKIAFDLDIPKVACMEIELDNVKIVHGGKTKSLETVKNHLSKHQKSLINRDLNIVNILRQVRVNKGFEQDDYEGFFQYLEEASVEDLRCIIEVLKCDKDIIIDLIQFRACSPDAEEFVTNCKLRVNNEPSVSFKSMASDKNESERKAHVLLLKYLCNLKD
ncbi:hypothetical protein WDU94_014897 [Cyamophila willieti]